MATTSKMMKGKDESELLALALWPLLELIESADVDDEDDEDDDEEDERAGAV